MNVGTRHDEPRIYIICWYLQSNRVCIAYWFFILIVSINYYFTVLQLRQVFHLPRIRSWLPKFQLPSWWIHKTNSIWRSLGISGPLFIFKGTTAEQFLEVPASSSTQVSRSKYDVLREHLAKRLSVPIENVDIFNVRDHESLPGVVDIRYSAHGSPYYRPEKLDGLMSLDKDEVH